MRKITSTKKIIGISSLVLTAFILIFTFLVPLAEQKQLSDNTENTGTMPAQTVNSKLTFTVIGDVHTDAPALKNLLVDLQNVNTDMDLMVLNGDIMEQGLDKEYAVINDCLRDNEKLLPRIVVKNIGNHEFFDYEKGPNSLNDVEKFKSNYFKYSGEERVYHHRWIKGYHFISLGSEKTYTSDVSSVQAFISDEQLNWLSNMLAEDYKPGRPILVFLHQPYTSSKQGNALKEILSRYPEVILFSSHTHTFLELNNIAYQTQPFLAVHTGAVHRPIRWDNSTVGRSRNGTSLEGSQGLFVEIDDGKVLIRGRDFVKGTWIEDAVYTVDFKQ